MDDLEPAVAALLNSPAEDAFLIVTISGTPDFLQLAGYLGSAYIDFPQVTDRQKQLRPKVELICRELDLPLTINTSTNGIEFLDYDLPSDAAEIAAILEKILIELFGANSETVLEFKSNGFDLPNT